MNAPREFDTCVVCDRDFSVAKNGTVRAHGPANNRCSGSRRLGVQSKHDTRVSLGWAARGPESEPENA